MIARIWQGRTRPGKGEAYFEYLEKTGLKEYRSTEGFRGVLVLRREIGKESEYVLVSLWDDMEAVKRFAGADPERAIYYPDDARYFPEQEFTTHVKHYDVLVER
jgi:heme-degrading monooxygenase HmoA